MDIYVLHKYYVCRCIYVSMYVFTYVSPTAWYPRGGEMYHKLLNLSLLMDIAIVSIFHI